MIPQDDAGTDVGTPADDAAASDLRVFADLGQMPYPRVGPQFCPLVDVGGGLYVNAERDGLSDTVRLHPYLPGLGGQQVTARGRARCFAALP